MKSGSAILTHLSLFSFFFILIFPSTAKADFARMVRPGESLFCIAKRFQVTVSQLRRANGLLGDEKIYPGQRLAIPVAAHKTEIQSTAKKSEPSAPWQRPDVDPDVPDTQIVKEGETIAKIARYSRLRVADLRPIHRRSGETLKGGRILRLQEEAREEFGAGREKSGAEDMADRKEWTSEPLQGKGSLPAGKDPQLLVRVARSFLGLKYRRGGNTPGGLDCSAFVQRVFRVLGIDLPRTAREQFQVGYQVAREALQMGDLVFFKRSQTARPAHVGIYIGDGRFIHTSLRK